MSDTKTSTGGTLLTPFNMVAGLILLMGSVITVLRFTGGLGAVTNLSDYNPWGLWIGFDLLVGVALAAGGFVTSAACYIFGLKRYHSAVRPAILTAFLGYALVVFALNYDVGRPWRLPYPFIVQPGTTSLLFEVGACVALYLTVLFIEYTPAALEWLGLKRARSIVVKLTLLLTIFGVVLSTLHQSSLGALYLIAPSKLHPLWYSGYLPVYFFISAIIAGLSMVIFESSLAHKHFHDKDGRNSPGGGRRRDAWIRQSGRFRAFRVFRDQGHRPGGGQQLALPDHRLGCLVPGGNRRFCSACPVTFTPSAPGTRTSN